MKGKSWAWTGECHIAFDTLKVAISSKSILKLLAFEQPFEVNTYASNKAMGGVLQQGENPIAFKSWKLKEAKTRHSAHEKEMLVMVHFKFVVITDNVANTLFKTQKKLSSRQARW